MASAAGIRRRHAQLLRAGAWSGIRAVSTRFVVEAEQTDLDLALESGFFEVCPPS